MKEDKNIVPTDLAAESISAIAQDFDDEQLYGIDHWPGMPLVGPTNIDETIARIDEAEREIDEDGGMDWSEFKSMLINRHTPAYAV